MKKLTLFSIIGSLLLLSFYAYALPLGGIVVSYTLEKSFYRPGESGEIFITVSNPTSYPLNDVLVTVEGGSYITPKIKSFSLDNLPAGASQQIGIVFTVNSSAKATISYLKVHTEYEDYGETQRKNDLVIPIKIYREPLLKVYVDKLPEFRIGKSEKVCFTLLNYGGEAKDVSIIPNSSVFSFSPAQRFVSLVDYPQKVCFNVKPIITIPGNFPFTIFVTYYDSLREHVYSDSFNYWANISGKIDLTVYIESFSKEENALTIVFSNSGSEDIKALHVKLSSDIELWPKEIYIGDLDRDDYDSERIVLEKVPGKHKINVTVKFRDLFEREYEKTYSLQVFIPEEEKKEGFNHIYLLVAGFVLISLVFWKLRK